MKPWLFLSKNGNDEYINMFARGSGAEPYNTDYFDYHYDIIVDDQIPVLRGILKYKIMQQCWNDGRDFYYMDSGYFGNNRSSQNPNANKLWHRVVKNNLQHGDIVERPDDRWKQHNLSLNQRRHGSKIIVAAPDEKPCRFYGIDQQQWINDTVNEIKKHTDRPVIVRERAPKRIDRTLNQPLSSLLSNDVHALVTFNSVAATESVIQGVPAFVLAPCNAAMPVANTSLANIENPYFPDDEKRYAWVCHLAYGQFHVSELRNGAAYKILNNDN